MRHSLVLLSTALLSLSEGSRAAAAGDAPPVGTVAKGAPQTAEEVLRAAVPVCPAADVCFGLRVRVATEDGAPVVSPVWLAESFAVANQLFAPVGIAFQLDALMVNGDMTARVDGAKARDTLVLGIPAAPVIDAMLVRELIDLEEPRPIFGVHWRVSSARKRRFVIVSSAASTRVLAHELGHYFGLPHSAYAVSIMNKTPRAEPPPEQRRFADEELPILRRTAREIQKRRELAPVPKP
jgi:Matrixin